MSKNTQSTLSRQHAEQLPDRKAMSTIDPTGADAQTCVVTPDDGLQVFASVDGDATDDGASMDATSSGVYEDTPAAVSTSASSTDTDDLATSLSVALRADDIDLDVSAVSLSR